MTIEDERIERKRKQDRESQARRRRLVDEGKARFCFELHEDLVATALFRSGRDRGLELNKHEECEQCLFEWISEILDAVVSADLHKSRGPGESLRSNRKLK